jgi:hypothetical protein
MFFRQDATMRGLLLPPDDDPVTFRVPPPADAKVTIRGASEDEMRIDMQWLSTATEDARAWAEIEADPPPGVLEAFEAIEQRRLPDSSPRDLLDTRWVDSAGNFKGDEIVHMDHLSDEVQEFLREIRKRLRRGIRATFSAIAWRTGVTGAHDPVQFGQTLWALEEEEWELYPTGRTGMRLLRNQFTKLDDGVTSDIDNLIEFSLTEPLAHALWREASAQQRTNPRSAILIGLASLEVGIKQHASLLVPHAEWLLVESPTPPVVKMLAKYLPALPPNKTGRPFKRPPKRVLTVVENGVRLRNEVTHKGVKRIPPETVSEILATVRDLLWQLDLALGLEWAVEHLSDDAAEHVSDDAAEHVSDDD